MRRLGIVPTVVAIATGLLGLSATPAVAAGEAIAVNDIVMNQSDGCVDVPYATSGDFYQARYWSVQATLVQPDGTEQYADYRSALSGSSPTAGSALVCDAGTGTYTLRAEITTWRADATSETVTVSDQFSVRVLKTYATVKRQAVRKQGHKIWKITGVLHNWSRPAGQPVQIEMKWKGHWARVVRKRTKADGTVVFTANPKRTATFDPADYKFRLNWLNGPVTRTFRLPATR